MMNKKLCLIPIFLFLLSSLTSCFNAVTTGAQAVYNRHQIGSSASDHYISFKADRALYNSRQFKDANVSVATYHGQVLLAGQVPNEWQKQKAYELVKDIPNVTEIFNLITVQTPSSTLTRLNDTWLTSKIKSKLMASNEVDASEVKVITENGVVYLMGVLPVEDAEAAIELARTTDGVVSVVKLFSYMTISKKPLNPSSTA